MVGISTSLSITRMVGNNIKIHVLEVGVQFNSNAMALIHCFNDTAWES